VHGIVAHCELVEALLFMLMMWLMAAEGYSAEGCFCWWGVVVYDEMYLSLSKASAVIRGWTNSYYVISDEECWKEFRKYEMPSII